MTQNTHNPDDWSLYTFVETAPETLTNFNPDKVVEMVNAAMIPFGGVPPVAYLGCGAGDTLISVALPNPVTQQQLDDAMTALLAICADPTRSDIPSREQAKSDAHTRLKAKYAAMKANGNLTLPEVKAIILDMLLRMDEDIDIE